jgi:AsmA protein
MNPWIRRTAIALGALLLLLVVAAAVLIATFDANRYKGLAIDWMKTERQRTLVIDGPIELSVFPRLAIKVSKVKLSEHARPDEFVAIDEAALAVQTLPLLRKQVVVDRISARGVRAVYQRDAKGVRNIDDLIGTVAPAPAAPASPPSGGGTAVRFDVSAVKLEGVQLRVRDAMAKIDGQIALQSFSSGRLANQAESPVSLRATMQLTQPQPLKLAVDGDTTLALDLDKGAVGLRNMKLGLQLDGAGAKDLSLAVSGALAWDGTALRAGPLKVALKAATFGRGQATAVQHQRPTARTRRAEARAGRAPWCRHAVRGRTRLAAAGGRCAVAERQRAVGAGQDQRADRAGGQLSLRRAEWQVRRAAAARRDADCARPDAAAQG